MFVLRPKKPPERANVGSRRVPFEAELGGGRLLSSSHSRYSQPLDSALRRTPLSPVTRRKGFEPFQPGTIAQPRLADVVITWNVYEHFYPYFDIAKPDWPAVLGAIPQVGGDDASRCTRVPGLLRRLVASAKDGHGYVGHRSDDAFRHYRRFWRNGWKVVRGNDGWPRRWKSRSLGDEIVSIDGKSTGDCWRRLYRSFLAGATEQWRKLAANRRYSPTDPMA